MLRAYPAAAVAQNWVHEALTKVVQQIHDSRGGPPPPLGWFGVVDAKVRPTFERRPALKSRVDQYAKAVAKTTVSEFAVVVAAFEAQNAIEGLLDGTCEFTPALPGAVADAAKALFVHGFEMLTDLRTRDHQYTVIWEGSADCPFCGLETFDGPTAPREDLDHYLVRALYPFAAANLQNLVPMGSRCNKSYKKQADMIRDLTGARRIAFYPYGCGSTRILLDGDASMEDGLPRFVWRVSFDPASAEAETWDQVFSVRTRLDRDLLNCSQIGRWIRSFGEWCRRKLAEDDIANPVVIRAVMLDYAKDAELFPHGRDAYIPQVFRLLHRWCDDDEKLFAFIIDMVRGKPAI